MAETYNIQNQIKGDTFDGVEFTLIDIATSIPIDLTDSNIKIQFRYRSKVGQVKKEITEISGITITDAINGVFEIDSFIIDWTPDIYYYDVQITFIDSRVKTYIEGALKILQDVTTNG